MGHHWAGGMMTQWLLQRTWGSVPRTHMIAYNHLESMAIHIQLFNNIYKSTPILLSCETKIPGNIFFPKAVAIVRVLNAPERPMCGRFGLQLATVLRSGWTFRRWSVMGTLSHWSCALWATRTLLSLCFLESMGWIDLLSQVLLPRYWHRPKETGSRAVKVWVQRWLLLSRCLFLAPHHGHGKITQGHSICEGKVLASFSPCEYMGNTGALRLLTALNWHQTGMADSHLWAHAAFFLCTVTWRLLVLGDATVECARS